MGEGSAENPSLSSDSEDRSGISWGMPMPMVFDDEANANARG